MNFNRLPKLKIFLTQLEKNKIHYTLTHHRDKVIMVTVVIPGQRWEIEFFENGLVELEKFKTSNDIEEVSFLSQIFVNCLES
jgi:mRNA degradation ribonuclease J1/J2